MDKLIIEEIEGHWVAAHQEKYDDDMERSIIGYGDSKEVAAENALIRCIETIEKLENMLLEITETLKAQDFEIPGAGKYIHPEGVEMTYPDGSIRNDIDAIAYDDKKKRWCWFFR